MENYNFSDNFDDILDEIVREEIGSEEFSVKSDKRLIRRKRTAHKKNSLIRKAKSQTKYPGPYFNEEKGRVIFAKRPRASKMIKKIAARKARRTNVGICGKANYRRVYDFWWQLT